MKYPAEIEIAEPMPDEPSSIERDEHTPTHHRSDRVTYPHKEQDHVTEQRGPAPSESRQNAQARAGRELRS